MSVDEIIAQLRELEPGELRQVQAALAALASEPDDGRVDETKRRRAEAAWQRLEQGWCRTGGQSLSENIDQALYGGEA